MSPANGPYHYSFKRSSREEDVTCVGNSRYVQDRFLRHDARGDSDGLVPRKENEYYKQGDRDHRTIKPETQKE